MDQEGAEDDAHPAGEREAVLRRNRAAADSVVGVVRNRDLRKLEPPGKSSGKTIFSEEWELLDGNVKSEGGAGSEGRPEGVAP